MLFHAVYLEKLPMVVRRLDAEERKLIKSGDVHVWEERGPSTEGLGLGIERLVFRRPSEIVAMLGR